MIIKERSLLFLVAGITSVAFFVFFRELEHFFFWELESDFRANFFSKFLLGSVFFQKKLTITARREKKQRKCCTCFLFLLLPPFRKRGKWWKNNKKMKEYQHLLQTSMRGPTTLKNKIKATLFYLLFFFPLAISSFPLFFFFDSCSYSALLYLLTL